MSAQVVRGVELAYDVSGEGHPPMIWGHGLTSSRAAEDRAMLIDARGLASVTGLVRYDARGHGESALSSNPADYAWDAMARDQLALADHLAIDRYVAGGASLGAATALHAAVIAPERIVALVLVIPPTAWETRAAQTDQYQRMADLVERRGVELLARAAADLPQPDPLIGNEEWRDAGRRRLLEADPVRLATVFRGAGTADLPDREQVSRIGVPTLILAWTGDPGHPLSTATELESLLPDAQMSVASTYDDFAGWTDDVLTFLGSLPALG
jgi:pimeloyl-ACP methyl ester carboxylesterase